MSTPFHIICISAENFLPQEEKMIASLLQEGITYFHLRKPDATESELRSFIEKIPDQFHERLIIHQHYTLINEFKLKGIHLPERFRGNLEIFNKYYHKVISSSFHYLEDLHKSSFPFHYHILSPVYNSISKPGHDTFFKPSDLKKFLNEHPEKKIIALGGVTVSNISEVQQMGFAGAALLGAIWESGDPVESWRGIKKVLSTKY